MLVLENVSKGFGRKKPVLKNISIRFESGVYGLLGPNGSGNQPPIFYPSLFWNMLKMLSGYRLQMPITEVMIFSDGSAYYVCPRCHMTVEREFMSFCDRCGQHLSWVEYRKARQIYPGQRTR